MAAHLKNIALIGASGNLGQHVLSAILATKHVDQKITAIARTTSTATFPDSVVVKKGDLTDSSFLESAFAGQDIVIFMLGIELVFGGDETRFIEAAARAGVKYVVPSEFGCSSEIPAIRAGVPFLASRLKVNEQIQALGMKYIIFSTNGWLDFVSPSSSSTSQI
jgi:uncharacterized protein YbjT (DUF2867 family)